MKRRLLIVAILLLAGAVVNVAVAWVAWWGTECSLDPVGRKTFRRVVDQPLPSRADMKRWAVHATDSWPWNIIPVSRIDRYTLGVRYRHLYCSSGLGEWEVALAECGWPMHAFTLDAWRGGPNRRTVPFQHDGWLILGAPIPGRLLWLGFAVNTVFYAAILWLLGYSALALRRFFRRRRGLCTKCAYPVSESAVCTECGHPVPLRAAAG